MFNLIQSFKADRQILKTAYIRYTPPSLALIIEINCKFCIGILSKN